MIGAGDVCYTISYCFLFRVRVTQLAPSLANDSTRPEAPDQPFSPITIWQMYYDQ